MFIHSSNLTWAPPRNFHHSGSDAWIKTVDLDKYPSLDTKRNEATTYELTQLSFKAFGEFWIKRSNITQYVAPIAVVTGFIVSAYLLSIPGILFSLSFFLTWCIA